MQRQKLEEGRFTSTWLGVTVVLSGMLDEADKGTVFLARRNVMEFLQWLTDQRWLVGLTVRHPLGGEASVVVLVVLPCS